MRHWWFMTVEVLSKLRSKTNVKVALGTKQTKKAFCSTLLKVNRQKIYYPCRKEKFPLAYGSFLEMPAAPRFSCCGSVCMAMVPWMSPGKIGGHSDPSRTGLESREEHRYPTTIPVNSISRAASSRVCMIPGHLKCWYSWKLSVVLFGSEETCIQRTLDKA